MKLVWMWVVAWEEASSISGWRVEDGSSASHCGWIGLASA